MKISEKYVDIKFFDSFTVLQTHGLDTLRETIASFFCCEVSFLFEPRRQAKEKFEIDISQNPKRGCYPINDDLFFIFARIIDHENNALVSGLGIVLESKSIRSYRSLLNTLEGALTNKLTHLFFTWFRNCLNDFSDNLLIHTMGNYCSRGYLNFQDFEYLVSYFHKVKTTTFEGKSFSTGLIITKSHFSYKLPEGKNRHGQIFPLIKRVNVKKSIQVNRRFWYLADGKHTYFVSNKELEIQHLFILGTEYAELDYIDSNSLILTLKGGDVLFRVENEKQFSIVIAEGLEFVYHENSWRVRDYNLIKLLMQEHIANIEVINKLLFFILYCSKNSISSVIWVPSDISLIDKFIKPQTLNQLIYEPIQITDRRFTNQILRYLSSDGATIVNSDGLLMNFGCIVDLSNLKVEGIKGTGESAAEVLSENGLSFKISQDGTIKMFLPNVKKAFII